VTEEPLVHYHLPLKKFENCSECKKRVIPFRAARGGFLVNSTHLSLKMYYVQDRLKEIRPVTTKTYIVSRLKHLLTGKALLYKAGFRIKLDADNDYRLVSQYV
jgi:hypothetical protein